MGSEQILVVSRTDLFAAGHWQGFSDAPGVVAHFLQLLVAHGHYVPRRPAEADEELKQIVPYGVVLSRGQVFLFRRGAQGKEAGLRGRWSVGLGGHVNPADGLEIGPGLLERALWRELAEEVSLQRPRCALWGVLNDDSDPVGRRHFGFVYRVQVALPEARSREAGKIRGRFVPWPAAQAHYAEMETWSRIVLDALAHADARPC